VALGDRIPGSGTTAIPVYRCGTCRDSGQEFRRDLPFEEDGEGFRKCPACDGKSRLAGEVDEPATPALDLLRDVRNGGPA
jgi:hypothetical protein